MSQLAALQQNAAATISLRPQTHPETRAAKPSMSDPVVKSVYYVAPLVAVVLVALIYQFGYPLLITLAVFAAFAAIALIVGLTALDLKSKPAARKQVAPEAAAQAA
jgi:energy-converting hydrogenase Eha subunit E